MLLKNSGLRSPYRVKRLVREVIGSLELDLEGLTVLTEAASNNYVVTPIIAAMAGAKIVYAITTDSQYGTTAEVAELTYKFADFCGVKDNVKVLFSKSQKIVSQADIVTNLGFVRPIDMKLVGMMKSNAVIPLMCEAWELRRDDIALDACRERGLPVMATNEDYPGLEVFDYSGYLCLKMLLELEIEIYKSKVAIISSDKFGTVVEKYLCANGSGARIFKDLRGKECLEFLADSDALIIADYGSSEIFIGRNGQITAEKLQSLSPGISVIQFCGIVEIDELDRVGIPYFPSDKVGTRRMGMTLAALGPRPVVELHTAGLKVGELMARARQEGLGGKHLEEVISAHERWAGLAVPL